MTKLSVIIVNYKSANFIIDCLTSASIFESFLDFEWIIVDNKSNDNSKTEILSRFPNVIWHEMGYNAGFARANNAGIKMSQGDIVLLLNPDTLIIDNAILRCFEVFSKSTHVACGVQMLNKDHSTQISGSNFMKGGINHLLPLPYWGSFLKKFSSLFNVAKPSIELASEEEKVDWISGAFLMVKKEAIEQCGLMDEDFFLYGEEVEWCSRLYRLGSLCIYGKIHIIHIMGEVIASNASSLDKSYSNLFDKKGLQLILSNHVRIRKQYGVSWFLFQLANYTISIPIYLICSIIDHIIHFTNPYNDFKKIIGLTRNVLIIWKHCITILLNRTHFYKVI